MLSSLLRPRKGRRRIDHSPFSSPFQSSPIPANNTAHDEDGHSEEGDARDDERAHTYDDNGQTYNEDDIDEDEEDEEDGPLLPIFSAAILGRPIRVRTILTLTNRRSRCVAYIRYHSFHSNPHSPKMRNDTFLGPAARSPAVSIPRQADPVANQSESL